MPVVWGGRGAQALAARQRAWLRCRAGYGPLDQGAINQYYEHEVKGRPISKDFNAKPYQVCVCGGGGGERWGAGGGRRQGAHPRARLLSPRALPGCAQEFRPEARIVHLHGPKPNHYLQWLLKGTCSFGPICEMGFAHASCQYFLEYAQWAVDWEAAQTLLKLCKEGGALVTARVKNSGSR